MVIDVLLKFLCDDVTSRYSYDCIIHLLLKVCENQTQALANDWVGNQVCLVFMTVLGHIYDVILIHFCPQGSWS